MHEMQTRCTSFDLQVCPRGASIYRHRTSFGRSVVNNFVCGEDGEKCPRSYDKLNELGRWACRSCLTTLNLFPIDSRHSPLTPILTSNAKAFPVQCTRKGEKGADNLKFMTNSRLCRFNCFRYSWEIDFQLCLVFISALAWKNVSDSAQANRDVCKKRRKKARER